MRGWRAVRTVVVATAVAATLAGCGRKGDLDRPYDAGMEARREAERNKQPVPPEPEAPPVDRPFILDGLI